MSRIGKKPIAIPSGTDVVINEGVVTVKGPLGTLSREMRSEVSVSVENGVITVAPTEESKFARALWGTVASHITNMLDGVQKPYVKKLVVEGVGFRVESDGKNIKMALGFSHPVIVPIPEGITVVVEKNTVTISGIDKEKVGQFAAEVRTLKKPEPYKGKGIRYDDEVIRRKQGKKAV